MGISSAVTVSGVTALGLQSISTEENSLGIGYKLLNNKDFNGVISSQLTTSDSLNKANSISVESPLPVKTVEDIELLIASLNALSSELKLLFSSGPHLPASELHGSGLPSTGKSLPEASAAIQSLLASIKSLLESLPTNSLGQQEGLENTSLSNEELGALQSLLAADEHSVPGALAQTETPVLTRLARSIAQLQRELQAIANASVSGEQPVAVSIDANLNKPELAAIEQTSLLLAGNPIHASKSELNTSAAFFSKAEAYSPTIQEGRAVDVVAVRDQLNKVLVGLKELVARVDASIGADLAATELKENLSKINAGQFSGLNASTDVSPFYRASITTAAAVNGILAQGAAVEVGSVPEAFNVVESPGWITTQSSTQSLAADSASRSPAATPVFRTNLDLPVTSEPWGQQFGQRLNWIISQGISTAELMLNPAELGPLKIRVEQAEQSTRVAFVVQHAATREILETQLPRLRDMFVDKGLDLVDVESHDMSQFAQSHAGTDDWPTGPGPEKLTSGIVGERMTEANEIPSNATTHVVVAQLRTIDTFA